MTRYLSGLCEYRDVLELNSFLFLLLSSNFTMELTDLSLPVIAVVKNAWSRVFPEV
jgi:hypothetical protein